MSQEKQFYVYIMADSKHHTLYTGVTGNLQARVYQHKEQLVPGFTSRYRIKLLVYYEEPPDALSAIAREKQIKGGSRVDKIKLITNLNPLWLDLHGHL